MTEELTVSITMRITPADKAALDRIAARHPMLKPLTIARFAFRKGLQAVEADPSIFYASDDGLAAVQSRLAAGEDVPAPQMYSALVHQEETKKRAKAKR